MDDKRSENSVATARAWTQGNIAGLDDSMTRRLVASTVYTESNGGDLAITNDQGYVGRYQAGAGWLADAGLVDQDRYRQALKDSGYTREWDWAVSGGMTRFLNNPENWNNGLSLEQYKASADVQDGAFKTISDAAYQQAMRTGVLHEGDTPEHIAGILKARHISGAGGAAQVVQGSSVADSNGTSNADYYNDIAINQDRLDAGMGLDPARERSVLIRGALQDGQLAPGEKGEGVRQLQEALAAQGYTVGTPDGKFGPNTERCVREYQQAHGMPVTATADAAMLATLGVGQHIRQMPDGALRDGRLEHGEKGDAVRALQQALRDNGEQVGVDGDFGSGTQRALKHYQEGAGLPSTGVADRETLQSLELGALLQQIPQSPSPSSATPQPAAAAPPPPSAPPSTAPTTAAAAVSMADPGHPEHAMYAAVVGKLEALGDRGAFQGREALERAAGQIVVEAKVSGLQKVDHVVPSNNGGFIAVEGGLQDPAHRRVYVDQAQAVNQSVEQSSRQLETLNADVQRLQAQEPAQNQARGMPM
ncbi:peptidoglycan hydrolase-like protein with peptidoglycan-binding domain [Xanthomonas sp. JAI131]|jgi:peptidoglycan hydrolase-like protein with peptidoglycan-binding domain|uniref:peptidoglycan-binding domain-containing protein n=1 Tax=Xanthomonas sp. JAI131 TaxID=2723067 RepID=UPI0015CB25A2|nr:peptidoglycan-binding protein [Xanthomonas sp. JAI131]NYF23127.1 peptidoglycan hydrolase-like protein with peptidoglycan-binding domain [Xanthomonas sp. JAI131]